jgi:hypothetical protein
MKHEISKEMQLKVAFALRDGLPKAETSKEEDDRFEVLKACVLDYLNHCAENNIEVSLNDAITLTTQNIEGCDYDDYKELSVWSLMGGLF